MIEWTFYTTDQWWDPATWDWSRPAFVNNERGTVRFHFLFFAIGRKELY